MSICKKNSKDKGNVSGQATRALLWKDSRWRVGSGDEDYRKSQKKESHLKIELSYTNILLQGFSPCFISLLVSRTTIRDKLTFSVQ